ncbi:hypothetical protein ACP0HM_24780 [Escherichia coli]
MARIMTEQQISRTQAWLESLRPKTPRLCCNYRRDSAGMVARSLRSAGRPAGTNYRRAITDPF